MIDRPLPKVVDIRLNRLRGLVAEVEHWLQENPGGDYFQRARAKNLLAQAHKLIETLEARHGGS